MPRTRSPGIRRAFPIPYCYLCGALRARLNDWRRPADTSSRVSGWPKWARTASIKRRTWRGCAGARRIGPGRTARYIRWNVDTRIFGGCRRTLVVDWHTHAFRRDAGWNAHDRNVEFSAANGSAKSIRLGALPCPGGYRLRLRSASRPRSLFARRAPFRIARDHYSTSPSYGDVEIDFER